MRVAIIIPARYQSSRFPGKPLASLRGATGLARTLLSRTIDVAQAIGAAGRVFVATDDARIAAAAEAASIHAVMTPASCLNGTERCQAAVEAARIEADIIVNLQGDAPLTPTRAIDALIAEMAADPNVRVATPMIRCSPETVERLRADEVRGTVGGTTVVPDGAGDALYFSKRVLPYGGGSADCPVFLHLGLYAYRRNALEHYAATEPSAIEHAEGLEQLRFLVDGMRLRMVEIAEPAGGLWEVNNPGDVPIVESALAARGIA